MAKKNFRQENYICCNCFCDSFQCGCYRAAKVYDDVKIRNARYLLGNSAAGYGWVVWCFLMIQFMSGIPNDILEAANIDGSNEIQTFFYIIMPSVKPALFTLTIFTFIATWPLSGSQFTYSESLKMLPTMLAQLNSGGISRTGVAAAGTVIMMLPSIIVFLICQGSVIETMTYSGIKG